MLDDYIKGTLSPNADTRLFGVQVRGAFVGVADTEIARLLERLNSGGGAHGVQLQAWTGRFSQLSRNGDTGAGLLNTLNALTSGVHGLTGLQLNTFWNAALGATGGSEVLIGLIRQLLAGHNGLNPQQIVNLVLLFINGTPTGPCLTPGIRLAKADLLTAINALRGKFSPMQVQSFCFFFQSNLVPGPTVTGQRFLAICQDVHAGAFTTQQWSIVLQVHGTLSNGALAKMLFVGPLLYTMGLLHSPLSAAAQAVVVIGGNAADLLAFAEGHGSALDVARVLTKAHAAGVPFDVVTSIFAHLHLMVAGDRVQRLGEFIDGAAANRRAKGRDHSWTEIMGLVDRFTNDQRITHGPGGLLVGARIAMGQRICTGERIQYFLKAHTFRFFDFSLVGRSQDDITLFLPGATEATIRGIVAGVFGQVDAEMITGVVQGNGIDISNVTVIGTLYEIGLIQNGNENAVALVHLMPFTVNPGEYWHKDLLRAVGRMF